MRTKPISKYSICHPLITPEFFHSLYDPYFQDTSLKVKSLAIYSETDKYPELIYDSPIEALKHTFQDKYHMCEPIRIHPNFHMYIDLMSLPIDSNENIIATRFYRLCASSISGKLSSLVIRGPVLIFSSVSSSTNEIDGIDYSVPYEVLEQVIRLHNNYVDFK